MSWPDGLGRSLILSASYSLKLGKNVLFGDNPKNTQGYLECRFNEKIVLSILIIFVIYLIIVFYVYSKQRSLLYIPNIDNYDDEPLTINAKEIFIQNSEGNDLRSLFFEHPIPTKNTLLMLHGNAGPIENRFYKINKLAKNKIKIYGPYPGDSVLTKKNMEKYNCFVFNYHDQALIPFKMISKNAGINYTSGLSIIRVSPDHGTAYDIVGKNKGSIKGLINCVNLIKKIYIEANINAKTK